jgi:hypothetical protein
VTQVEDQGKEYLLYLKAKTKTVAYDQLKMWVDKEKVQPTRIECMTEASMLIKTIYFKDIKDFGGGIVRPATVETDSPFTKGTSPSCSLPISRRGKWPTRFSPSPTCRTWSLCDSYRVTPR